LIAAACARFTLIIRKSEGREDIMLPLIGYAVFLYRLYRLIMMIVTGERIKRRLTNPRTTNDG
jgi:hypothetical protein